MEFNDGTEFAFTTPRRIARISFHKSIEEEEPILDRLDNSSGSYVGNSMLLFFSFKE